MSVSSQGIVENTLVQKGLLRISSGGIVSNATIQNSARIVLLAGGTATDLNIQSGGFAFLNINSDTVLTGSSGGKSFYASNGVMSNITIISSCAMTVDNNWSAYNTILNGNYESAYMYIQSGGYAKDTVISSGYMHVSTQGIVENTLVQKGLLRISSGGIVSNATIQSGARITLLAGGSATDLNIQSGGFAFLDINSDTVLTGSSGGKSFYASNGVMSNITIISACSMTVDNNCSAYNTILNGYYGSAYMYIRSGGYAKDTVISSGYMHVSSFGIVDDTIISNGYMYIFSNGIAKNTQVFAGQQIVYSGGSVVSTILKGGSLIVTNKGFASDLFASAGGLYISSGGKVEDVEVASGAVVKVFAGGSLTSINLQSGATLILSSGSILGKAKWEDGAVISAMNGAIIEAAINKDMLTDKPLLTLLPNTVSANYRIHSQDISLCQKYLLADDIDQWNGTLSLYVSGKKTGFSYQLSSDTITNTTYLYNGVLYTVSEEEENLYFIQRSVFTPVSFYYDKGEVVITFSNDLDEQVNYSDFITIEDRNAQIYTPDSCTVSGRELRFSFNPADLAEYYTLILSPDFSNILGDKLNTDQDENGGETEDQYIQVFSPTLPLLKLQTTTDTKLSCYTGDIITFNFTVSPAEEVEVINTQCSLKVYLSADNKLDGADILLEDYIIENIDEDGIAQKYLLDTSLLPLRSSYLIVKADTSSRPFIEGETTEADNIQVFSIDNQLKIETELPTPLSRPVKYFTVTCTNAASTDYAAPLVVINLRSNGFAGNLSLNGNDLFNWPYNYVSLSGVGTELALLADSENAPGVIQANSVTENKVYLTTVQTEANAKQSYYCSVKYFYATDTEAMDWKEHLAELSVTQEYFAVLENALRETVGITVGDYVTELNKIKIFLAEKGVDTKCSANELLKLRLLTLEGSMCPVSFLAEERDLDLNNNACPLSLQRKMSSHVSEHYENSVFGYGWSWNWDAELKVHDQSAVTVKLPEWQGSYQFILNSAGYFESNTPGISLVKENGFYIVTDSTGKKYAYNTQGKLISVNDNNNNNIILYWDNDNLLSLRHSDGTAISLEYDQYGRIVSAVSSADGTKIQYAYDNTGNMISATDTAGDLQTVYQYEDSRFQHNLTGINNQNNAAVSYEYDKWGRLSGYSLDDTRIAVDIEYDLGTVKQTDQNGNTTSSFFNQFGQLIENTDAQGVTQKYTYDPNGRLTKLIEGDDQKYSFVYDDQGNCISITDELGNTMNYTYINNHIRTATDSQGNSVTFFYDNKWNVTDIKYSDGTAISYLLNEQGYCVSITDTNGVTSNYSYDSRGNLISLSRNDTTLTFGYDINNNLTSIKDALGGKQAYAYDSHSNLISFTDEAGAKTQYSYDSAGNLTSITYANGSKETFAYDQFGNLLLWSNARGAEITYTVNDQLQTTQAYVGGCNRTISYNTLGQITQADNMSFTYDNRGNLLSVTYDDGRKTIYEYDAADRIIRQEDETGKAICYSYDAYGNPDKLTTHTGDILVDYDFNTQGKLICQKNGNNTATVYSYTKTGDVEKISYLDADGTETGFCLYAYDINGNCSSKTTESGSWSYTWDKNGRLLSEVFTENSGVVSQRNTYTYDLRGNRLTQNINGKNTTYTYDQMNRIVTANDFTYRYDADG
ncbi:MAG: hypothetical protein J6W00_14505, partial [Lentisphaeria bacterium]|nr:hypothetical protein [Lentisphaeria bacterium]